ncbi:FAD binding domain-containing protein [Geodermatophilus sp. SYSU D00703]
MKPAPFRYLAARTTDEVVEQFAEHGPDARILAGGQSLIRLMNTRLAEPSLLVDIDGVEELDRIDRRDGTVVIGALTRQRASELSDTVRAAVPLLAEAGALVAHPSVRARGTVVGSVCFADPAAELPTALLALDGEVVARSARGERVIAAEDFFVAAHETSLEPDEFAVEVRVPVSAGTRTGSAFLELSRRHGELPVCGVAVTVALDPSGHLSDVRIALGSVAERPVRARRAEAALNNAQPSADTIAGAADLAAADLSPVSDCHGSAAFRRHLAVALTKRALTRAIARADGEQTDA